MIGGVKRGDVLGAEKFPGPGETVLGTDPRRISGGKGANLAVALSRLGASARLLGRVGADPWGEELVGKLRGNGVDTENVAAVDSLPTGNATIIVDQEGENRIVLIAGANDALLPGDVDRALAGEAAWDAILLQLEIPLETVCHAIPAGAAREIPLLLDVGPPSKPPLAKLSGAPVPPPPG